jgi:hypothetical protein
MLRLIDTLQLLVRRHLPGARGRLAYDVLASLVLAERGSRRQTQSSRSS